MSPCLWPAAQEAMDLLMEQGATPENLDRAQSLFEKVIAEAHPGSDELIAAYYGASVVHKIRGDDKRSIIYLLAYGKEIL